ncbi:hypothetical protein [Nannocystis radixulma]|uniref:Uncharacterized protein n=1 Tax=Nannocystis radixulma TaxID=2995305 RepID=A0ABT5B8R9_9BACT|nr:hypothetical protein [Nannocystis radixulma]MDC0670520.1 hypothetical protein [Nannocystis radixulma]
MTTFAAALLALLALGVASLATLDCVTTQQHLSDSREKLKQAEATLSKVKYDGQGNVVDEDLSQYRDAMATMSFETESLRLWRGGEQNAYPYMGGGLLAFLVFAAMAVRSTRRS